MQRCVDDAEILSHLLYDIRMDYQLFKRFNIRIIDIFSYHMVKPLLLRFLSAHRLYIVEISYIIDLINNQLIFRVSNLCTVLPVNFVAIVLRWVVARGNYHTRNAAERAQRVGEHRGRAQGLKAVSLNAVRAHPKRHFLRKFNRHMAGIIRDGNPLILAALLDNKIR